MFETLNGAGLQIAGGSADGSSTSDYSEGSAGADRSLLDASDPEFDNPEESAPRSVERYGADVANGTDDGHGAVDFEADTGAYAGEDVPFHNHPRWKELMGQKKALEDELSGLKGFSPVVERLRGMGYENAEVFEAALAAEEQRQFEANLAQALNAGVRNGTVPPAAAQAHFDAALRQRQIDQAMAQWQGYEINQQVQAAKRSFPEMDDEMVRDLARANYGRPGFDLAAVARRSHERNLAYLERRLSQYESERAEMPAAPISNERGSLAAGGAKTASRRSWEDLLGLTRLVKT